MPIPTPKAYNKPLTPDILTLVVIYTLPGTLMFWLGPNFLDPEKSHIGPPWL